MASNSNILALLEEAVFEAAHQVADFAAVDGAVGLTNRNHMQGFGGMIKGDFDQVNIVARALDTEGDQWREICLCQSGRSPSFPGRVPRGNAGSGCP